MSLTTIENGAVILSKARHQVCMEAAWELEALAYVLPTVTANGDHEALMSGFVVRGIASRYVTLANVLMAALFDEAETTADLERSVHVTPILSGSAIAEK